MLYNRINVSPLHADRPHRSSAVVCNLKLPSLCAFKATGLMSASGKQPHVLRRRTLHRSWAAHLNTAFRKATQSLCFETSLGIYQKASGLASRCASHRAAVLMPSRISAWLNCVLSTSAQVTRRLDHMHPITMNTPVHGQNTLDFTLKPSQRTPSTIRAPAAESGGRVRPDASATA